MLGFLTNHIGVVSLYRNCPVRRRRKITKVIDLPTKRLQEAPWNPNIMDEATLARLTTSIQRYGMLGNLVVRPLGNDSWQVLSGNQRLSVLCRCRGKMSGSTV
jgi:hypothetical protein